VLTGNYVFAAPLEPFTRRKIVKQRKSLHVELCAPIIDSSALGAPLQALRESMYSEGRVQYLKVQKMRNAKDSNA
jgi:hypothetical protein